MTSRSLTLAQQTRIAVNILIEDDTGALLYSLLVVTSLFKLLWRIVQALVNIKHEFEGFVTDIQTALQFAGKVLIISGKSLAFGVGLSL
jgi:hypothetical protein